MRSTRSRHRAWAVFISGRGSNLQAQLDLLSDLDLRLVVTSRASAPGVLRARRQGVPVRVLEKTIDWVALDRELRRRGITHLFLAGFMKMIPVDFVEAWSGRILNVHPSLLPAYPGLSALERSYDEGAAMGVTVHVVTAEMDAGPRLLQKPTLEPQSPPRSATLAEARWRISRAEQRLVREAVMRWR